MDITKADQLKTFSHKLYTAFFDSKIDSVNLHYPPNVWFYKGLATYYENLSIDFLPDEIKTKFGLNSNDGFKELYTRYIYFRLKEPAAFKLSPADEARMMRGQMQFFYYTEAPLVIKTIENIANISSGKDNAVISYLMKNAKEKKTNMATLMLNVIGSNEETIRNYLSGDKILPYPGVVSTGNEDPDKIVRQLVQYERLLWSWFSSERSDYPYDEIYLFDPDKLADEVIKKDIKFASDDVEKLTGAYSPTIAMLIKEYMLRASVCGEKDINDPSLIFKLNTDDNIKKWVDYLVKLGVKMDASSSGN